MKAGMGQMLEWSTDRPGDEPVPGYRLVARVGAGGAGEVWCAEAPGGLRVALKIVRLAGGLGRREVANVRILRAIRHPNLLAYFGAWQHRDRLIIGMELADGSLWDRLLAARRQGLAGIPLGELLEALSEVARVLDFLNEPCHQIEGRSGVAIHHRDVKPQNIMRIGLGVKLADFGLSCLDDAPWASGSHCGLTFAYAAPETFRRGVSAATDQYSLAVTYCQLRGGRLPLVGPPAAVMMGHLLGVPDLSMVPEPERPILARSLAKEPRERWPDCRTLIGALVDCAGVGVPETIPAMAGGPGGSVHLSHSVEIPPMSGEWTGADSAAPGPPIEATDPEDESIYCLDGPISAGAISGDDDDDGATAAPTVVRDGLTGRREHRALSRLGWVAASVLAAGLVAWSGSERIATRAAIPAAIRPIPAPGASIRAVVRRRPDPVPAPRTVIRQTEARSMHPGRTLVAAARDLVAARFAEVLSWEAPIRTATATARAWLADRSEVPRPSPPPSPPPGLRLGLPEALQIEVGRSVSIPIRVNRGGHAEAVSVHFEGLPAGVMIPDLTIPPGQDQATALVQVRLDAPATTATIATSIRAGLARANGRLTIRVRSNPAMLDRTRGHTLLACGRPAEAVAAFTRAIQAGVTDPRVFGNRALAYATLNQLDPAIKDYTEAIRLNPTDAAIRYGRGVAYARRGDDVRALLDFDAALRLEPGHVGACEGRKRIYQKHGDRPPPTH